MRVNVGLNGNELLTFAVLHRKWSNYKENGERNGSSWLTLTNFGTMTSWENEEKPFYMKPLWNMVGNKSAFVDIY